MPVFDRNQPTVTVTVPVPTPVAAKEPLVGSGVASQASPQPTPAAPAAKPQPTLHPSRRSIILPYYT